jgi:hypothetical protein
VHALTATDVASGWIELHSLLNNAHKWTFEALSHVKSASILPVLEFHSDNGKVYDEPQSPFDMSVNFYPSIFIRFSGSTEK